MPPADLPSAATAPHALRVPEGLAEAPAPPPRPRSLTGVAALFVATFAFLLASFPARNGDLWAHLAAGRRLVHDRLASLPALRAGWLYDLVCYLLYAAAGGAGLVLVKALLVAGLGLLLFRQARAGSRLWVAALCTCLAVLAMGTRLLLQPATASYLLLAAALGLARRPPNVAPGRPAPWLPPTPLLVLFVAWANLDGWFVVGLAAVALLWLGQALDASGEGDKETRRQGDKETGRPGESGLKRFASLSPCLLVSLSILAAACLLNPSGVYAFALPAELGGLGGGAAPAGLRQVTSPFEYAYRTTLGLTPAGLAYFVLLGLALLSFLLSFPRWGWQRLLPWLGLAVLSGLQVRTVPFFAVVAGPVLAWNLHDFFARRPVTAGRAAGPGPRARLAARALAAVFGAAFLVCAWPGWLQAPPFEPRRWAVEPPADLVRAAEVTGRWHADEKFAPGTRGLHLSPAAAGVFAWFCPEDDGLLDEGLAAAVLGEAEAPADWRRRLRAAGVNHLVVHGADGAQLLAALERLFADGRQWPLLYLEGGVAVFGWRDPVAAGSAGLFRGEELDLNRLAFRPAPGRRAPPEGPGRDPESGAWWEAFWRPAPPRPADRAEAGLYLLCARALQRAGAGRPQAAWPAFQAAGLVGSAAGWATPHAWPDARVRLALADPGRIAKLPEGQALAPALRGYLAQYDRTPAAPLYLAIRAARRALAVNPDDAQTYLVLGESYLELLHNTREQFWGERASQVVQLRHAQAVAALNEAVTLRPDLRQAHLSLGLLYGKVKYYDLALRHMRAYHKLLGEAGPPPGVGDEEFAERLADDGDKINQLAELVEAEGRRFEKESAGLRVLDRAEVAFRHHLVGRALEILLERPGAAAGQPGLKMELLLLLRTGRARDVRDWLGPEQEDALGRTLYHWLRAQALAASGDYGPAGDELVEVAAGVRAPGSPPPAALLASMVGRAVLEEQPGLTPLPCAAPWRLKFGTEYQAIVGALVQAIRQEANAAALRGLLALEQGDDGAAEAAFDKALRFWGGAAAAAEGRGLDFEARPLAQGYLGLLRAQE
jgi:hypothetical protein